VGAVCLLAVMLMGVADAAAADKQAAPEIPFTAEGQKLYAHYSGMLKISQAEIGKSLTEINEPAKAAFLKEDQAEAAATEGELLPALTALKGYVEGTVKLDARQFAAYAQTIESGKQIFGSNEKLIKAALDLVAAYDRVKGPLWVARGALDRKAPVDINLAVCTVMQSIMDCVYTGQNLATHGNLLDGYKFGSSANFPGAVAPPANPDRIYTVKVNASFPHTFGQRDAGFARRPTGAYLAPGSIATVIVPSALVGKGYKVRVGAHSWDFSHKPKLLRLDRSSLVYSIDGPEVKVASPLGGGIYIEVPYLAQAGVVDVKIKNAVRSPFFSATSHHQTSLAEWKDIERNRKAPWADFQSDKFMMQVPTSWIFTLDDPVALIQSWDAALDVCNDLMGRPRVHGRETMYQQVDLQRRGNNAFYPGYPTCNEEYDPKVEYNGYIDHHLVRGPRHAPFRVFHEQGHSFEFVKFAGEMEQSCNLLRVAVLNKMFNYRLDQAFWAGRTGEIAKNRIWDGTAVAWMTGEKTTRFKTLCKYIDIARLFGWDSLSKYWHSWDEDLEAGRPWSKDGTDIDKLSLRLSQAAGVDLTPLLHFWGTPPRDAAALKAAVAAAKLPPSAKVYDALEHYKSLVPKDNAAFRDYALKWWGTQPSEESLSEREYAKQWKEYDEKSAAALRDAARDIIEEYFPQGRPQAP